METILCCHKNSFLQKTLTVKKSKYGYFTGYLRFIPTERGVPLIIFINTLT